MIDNTYSQTMSVVEKSDEEIVLPNRNNQTIPWQAPQAEKLSRADLHIHSTYSDGIPTIEQILKHTELHTDLDVIAITDHNVIDGSLRARDLWARGSYRFDFIVGEEISTNEGHLLALFIEKHIPSHLSIDRIYANKDLCLDGIETWNAGVCGIYANRIAMRANRQCYGWSEVGNSDAHTLNAIGRACTWWQVVASE